MTAEVETVIDAEAISELQPPCDRQLWRNHQLVQGPGCDRPAQFIRKARCSAGGHITTVLRCVTHLMPPPLSYCPRCDQHDVPFHLISVEPL